MSSCIEVMVIVEGKTEESFIKKLVSPYLARNNIFMHATQIFLVHNGCNAIHAQWPIFILDQEGGLQGSLCSKKP